MNNPSNPDHEENVYVMRLASDTPSSIARKYVLNELGMLFDISDEKRVENGYEYSLNHRALLGEDRHIDLYGIGTILVLDAGYVKLMLKERLP